ncbi:receptor-like protein 34 [Cannabis sativa]|uniref:receptor-like protein 34 n=1 Tax=Cannabis sativa TaxID=3483 RepID=UPI0029CAA93F|nr:receptor-like protein 34 [Cannabis sativa]
MGSKQVDGFRKLQIVDLSFNHFNHQIGDKPRSMYMDEDDRSYYQESLTVTNKGFEREMVRILTILLRIILYHLFHVGHCPQYIFSCIDLSNNNFHGEISKSVGDLRSLIVLNLSSNNFEGHIPLSFGDLKQLESLDLSNNTLSGRIPQELATLTFLAYLNLSTNQLMGLIPQGEQFNTFENSSFYGNEDLCGFPLSKECEDCTDETPNTTLDDHESEF